MTDTFGGIRTRCFREPCGRVTRRREPDATIISLDLFGVPDGIRTRVIAVKEGFRGFCPVCRAAETRLVLCWSVV